MTDLERAQKIIEQYIHTLTWSPAATDDDITLVHGNVRGMASTIAAALAAVREADTRAVNGLIGLDSGNWNRAIAYAADAIRKGGT